MGLQEKQQQTVSGLESMMVSAYALRTYGRTSNGLAGHIGSQKQLHRLEYS